MMKIFISFYKFFRYKLLLSMFQLIHKLNVVLVRTIISIDRLDINSTITARHNIVDFFSSHTYYTLEQDTCLIIFIHRTLQEEFVFALFIY